jgi:thermostable 8-oxoguanine DNA glycosylase
VLQVHCTNEPSNTTAHQKAVHNHNLKVANKFFENVVKFEYLGRRVTNQYYIHKEVVLNLVFLCKSLKVKVPELQLYLFYTSVKLLSDPKRRI